MTITTGITTVSQGIADNVSDDPFADPLFDDYDPNIDYSTGPTILDIDNIDALPTTAEDLLRTENAKLLGRIALLEQDAIVHSTLQTLTRLVLSGDLAYYLSGPADDAERREWEDRVQGVAGWMGDHARECRQGRQDVDVEGYGQ